MERYGKGCGAAVEEFLAQVPAPLLESARPLRLTAGQVLVREGESVHRAWFLLSGEMVTFSVTEDGKRSSFLTLRPPAMISDLELLAGIPTYAANLAADGECLLLQCGAEAAGYWLDNSLPFLRAVAALCSRTTYASSYYRGRSAFRSSLDRVAIYLLRQCAAPAPGRDAVVTKTRQAMASELILSSKTVDRCLLRLRERDCLTISRGKVHIDAGQYQRLLEGWGGED